MGLSFWLTWEDERKWEDFSLYEGHLPICVDATFQTLAYLRCCGRVSNLALHRGTLCTLFFFSFLLGSEKFCGERSGRDGLVRDGDWDR